MDFLVHHKERMYFAVSLALSLLIYLMLVISLVGLLYLAIGGIVFLFIHGLLIGSIRGNGIRVSERQFPEAYHLARELASQMGFAALPPMYVVQAGGMINAFATRFLGRDYVIILSDIFELAYEQGEEALAFIICHELAHIKRGHLKWQWVLYPASFMPFLAQAYSRACEYTCDRIAAYYRPDGAAAGILLLSAGKNLYKNVNAASFAAQAREETGFWIWFAEILATHPHLPRRLQAMKNFSQSAAGTVTPGVPTA